VQINTFCQRFEGGNEVKMDFGNKAYVRRYLTRKWSRLGWKFISVEEGGRNRLKEF